MKGKRNPEYEKQRQPLRTLLARYIINKTCLSEDSSFALAGKLMNQFGFPLTAEVLQNMQSIYGIEHPYEYIIRIMQSEYIRRNGSQMPNINFGR